MKLPAAILMFVSVSACADQCLTYSGSVQLNGVLSRQTFPEQPNYESIAKGDRAATYFFVSSRKPFCVSAGAEQGEVPVSRVKGVQLMLSGQESFDILRPYLGKEVICSGKLWPKETGHHHSAVLLSNPKCNAAQPRAPADGPRAARSSGG